MAVNSSPDAVRHAVRADLSSMEAALADAFTDDPMMAWIYQDVESRRDCVSAFMRAVLEIGLPRGHVYTVGANAGGAVWGAPDVELLDEAAGNRLFGLMAEQLGPRAAEVGAGLMSLGEHHPHDEPHFYLLLLGTARAHQSRGAGSALIREVLDRCDRQGYGAYLESSNIRNVPFYERHGFRVLAEVKVSDTFTARPMWRDPQG